MEKLATFLSCFHTGLTGDPTICLLVDIQLTIIINAVTIIIIMEKHITVPVCVCTAAVGQPEGGSGV